MFAWKAGTLKCFQSPFLIVGGDAHAHITSRGVAKPQIAQCQVARNRRQQQPVSILRGSLGMQEQRDRTQLYDGCKNGTKSANTEAAHEPQRGRSRRFPIWGYLAGC